MKKFLFIASIFLFLLLFNVEKTFACSCIEQSLHTSFEEQVKESYEQTSYIFSAKVLSVNRYSNSGMTEVKLRLLNSWKGKVAKTIHLNTNSSSAACGYPFEKGKSYLIYGYKNDNKFSTNICTRTSNLKATKDIPTLSKLKAKK